MFLNKHIYSRFNPSYCYGYAGDEVEVLADHDTVKVVRHLGKKVGFPVNSEDLSMEKAKSEFPIIAQTIISNTASPKKTKDAKYKPTLF